MIHHLYTLCSDYKFSCPVSPYKDNTILLTTIPVLYITSPWLICLITICLYLFIPLSCFPFPDPLPLWEPPIYSLYLCPYSCLTNRFIWLHRKFEGSVFICPSTHSSWTLRWPMYFSFLYALLQKPWGICFALLPISPQIFGNDVFSASFPVPVSRQRRPRGEGNWG